MASARREFMRAKRVLLLYQDSLLAQGIVSLLRERVALEVAARHLKDDDLNHFVEEFTPDVVIVDREDLAQYAPTTVDQLLHERPHIRIIDMSSRDDVVRVYEGHEIRVAKFDDLLEVVRYRPWSPARAPVPPRRPANHGFIGDEREGQMANAPRLILMLAAIKYVRQRRLL
jgi:hypothetical protein